MRELTGVWPGVTAAAAGAAQRADPGDAPGERGTVGVPSQAPLRCPQETGHPRHEGRVKGVALRARRLLPHLLANALGEVLVAAPAQEGHRPSSLSRRAFGLLPLSPRCSAERLGLENEDSGTLMRGECGPQIPSPLDLLGM